VLHSFQPESPDACVTVYDEPGEIVNVHSNVHVIPYQAIVRIGSDTAQSVGETQARTLLEAVRSLHGLSVYDGVYLSTAMADTSENTVITVDDGSGTAMHSTLTVNDYLLIDSEVVRVVSKDGANVTVSRAKLGTVKAAHPDNTEAMNITRNPIPGEQCGSAYTEDGVIDMGADAKDRYEWAVNWKVRVKP
jgi:hypothetical protein